MYNFITNISCRGKSGKLDSNIIKTIKTSNIINLFVFDVTAVTVDDLFKTEPESSSLCLCWAIHRKWLPSGTPLCYRVLHSLLFQPHPIHRSQGDCDPGHTMATNLETSGKAGQCEVNPDLSWPCESSCYVVHPGHYQSPKRVQPCTPIKEIDRITSLCYLRLLEP